MLKNLYKYEFKWMLGKIVFAWIVLLSVAVLGLINNLFIETYGEALSNTPVLYTMSIVASAALAFLLNIAAGLAITFCLIMSGIRFYRNLYSSEGYFTMCIPVDASKHVFCKLIVTLVCMLLTVMVGGLAYCIFYAFEPSLFQTALIFINKIFAQPESWLYALEILFVIIAVAFDSVLKVYLAVSLGQCLKNKVFGAILFYFVIGFVLEIAISILGGAYFAILSLTKLINGEVAIHVTLWLAFLLIAGISVASGSIVIYRLKHRFNLE